MQSMHGGLRSQSGPSGARPATITLCEILQIGARHLNPSRSVLANDPSVGFARTPFWNRIITPQVRYNIPSLIETGATVLVSLHRR